MSGLMIIAGLGLIVYVIGMAKEDMKRNPWREYNETIKNFAMYSYPPLATTFMGDSWYGLSGEFRGRAISVESSSPYINATRQFQVTMTVDTPDMFSFVLVPFSNWQKIYNYSNNTATFYGLFHLDIFPQKTFGRMFAQNHLLADKFVESIDLFLGENNPRNMMILGEAGQIVVKHDKMSYSEDRLKALLNGLNHLAHAIEALPKEKELIYA